MMKILQKFQSNLFKIHIYKVLSTRNKTLLIPPASMNQNPEQTNSENKQKTFMETNYEEKALDETIASFGGAKDVLFVGISQIPSPPVMMEQEPPSWIETSQITSQQNDNEDNLEADVQQLLAEDPETISNSAASLSLSSRPFPLEHDLGLPEDIAPREYQREMFELIQRQWFEEQSPFGSIIFMPTGSGKTFVAIMLMLRIFERPLVLRKLTQLEQRAKQDKIAKQEKRQQGRKVAFMVPTTNLVEQQAEAINTHTDLLVGKYSGNHQKSQKLVPGDRQCENWRSQLETFDVFVFTEKKLYDVLTHGFIRIEEFDMIVFDECHHADQSHYYNLIMQDFYFYGLTDLTKRPKILGLTASPIKEKVGDCMAGNIDSEIRAKLQNLANNLYSKFVCISLEQIKQMEQQQTSVQIEQYEFLLEEKVALIMQIKDSLIMKLLSLLKINDQTIKINDPNGNIIVNSDPSLEARERTRQMSLQQQLELTVESMVMQEFEKQQDVQIVKFLKKRYELISIDMNYVKSNIQISSFKNRDDQILLIFIIVILKNANNLILELGPYSFMQFLADNKQDLLERMGQGSKKTDQSKQILNDFSMFQVKQNAVDQVTQVSKKVKKLIQILNSEVGNKKQKKAVPKVIIFVKDRVVAQYLRNILEKQIEHRSRPEHRDNTNLLDPAYRVAMAMGPRGKNLVNKAFRSTKQAEEQIDSTQDTNQSTSLDESGEGQPGLLNSNAPQSAGRSKDIMLFRSNLNSQVTQSQSSVKMSNNQLKEVLQKFRIGQVSILIATNVVEEGLDVSECNLVVCLNEMLNVKAFIQMKGRARQLDSKFIFLCANQEYEGVLQDKKSFSVVINSMKELAFGTRGGSSWGAIEPEPDIVQVKAQDESQYFSVSKTGARMSMRDSKLLLETFCKAAAESCQSVDPEEEQSDQKLSKHIKDRDPSYRTTSTAEDEHNRKYYFTCVYLPKTCGKYVGYEHKIMPESGFLRKRDSENHAALVSLRKLHENDCLDDYLFPKIGPWLATRDRLEQPQRQVKQGASKSPDSLLVSSPYHAAGAVRKVIIPAQEVENFKHEQVEFEREIKNNKSKFIETVEEGFRSLIKEKFTRASYDELAYIHCLKDIHEPSEVGNNKFPFQTTQDHLGIIFNRKFEQKNSIRFWMFQEKKQKEKNREYLNILLQNELISLDEYKGHLQPEEMIELELNKKNTLEVNFKEFCKDVGQAKTRIQQLKFFHTWVFYYFYCADHKFLHHVLKNKFTFVQTLFKETLDVLYRRPEYRERIRFIYCQHKPVADFEKEYVQNHRRLFYDDKTLLELYPFIVPLTEVKRADGQPGMVINWLLIERIQKYVTDKLLDIVYMFVSRAQIGMQLNLEKTFLPKRFRASAQGNSDMQGVWDDKFTGVRYVKLAKYRAHAKWDLPLLHLERRNNNGPFTPYTGNLEMPIMQHQKTVLVQDFLQNLQIDQAVLNSLARTPRQQFLLSEQKLDIYTVQQYNFDKYGLFLNPRKNPQLYEVRKERHFVDFSKTPKQLEKESASLSKIGQLQAPGGAQVSSKFDVTEQLIERSPLSYNQYQVFQQSCTHLLYFNEFLQVEKFIRDKFRGLKCFLVKRDPSDIQRLKQKSKGGHLAIDQIISQSKENLQSDLAPSLLSRDVFLSPNGKDAAKIQAALSSHGAEHYSAENQLLDNIDLMMEALTAPNANRNYDYERLEFYGDSVISFLVILELFLTKPYDYKEGHLDFYRIQQVSNMNFFKINKKEHFFKYMINEPQTIFNDFVPGAFDQLQYQERIKHKTLNEINNKIKELKRLLFQLEGIENELKRKGHGLAGTRDQSLLTQIRSFLQSNNLVSGTGALKPSSFADDQIYHRQLYQHPLDDLSLVQVYKKKVLACIAKIAAQKETKITEITSNKQKNHSKRQTHKKQFFFKQLADIVESVTGAATVACGLNLTQNYLRQIGVLKFDQSQLEQQLRSLKHRKGLNPHTREFVYIKTSEKNAEMLQIEAKIGYTFKDKLWLVEALTHKSYIDQNRPEVDRRNFKSQTHGSLMVPGELKGSMANLDQEISEDQLMPLDDYERLEFLGDAILNFLIAEHFYKTTVNDAEKKMPKELHKMKTSVINNALLSLIVIENRIHEHVLYNNKAFSFKEQFEKFVSKVRELLAQNEGGSTRESEQALDLDQLYEYNLKIFGDVFESLIGAIFIDSQSITRTWEVLYKLMEPYIDKYANLETLQDHSRTKLLELWNQKTYMRNMKCHHRTKQPNDQASDQRIIFCGMVDEVSVLEVPYDKDAKNKVRSFYRHYYRLIQGFFEELEKGQQAYSGLLSKDRLIQKLKDYRIRHFKLEEFNDESMRK